ncbi:MAG: hypothetical protein AAGG51_17360 [Cyanobacteria bacterium P01_G01_bin.54]
MFKLKLMGLRSYFQTHFASQWIASNAVAIAVGTFLSPWMVALVADNRQHLERLFQTPQTAAVLGLMVGAIFGFLIGLLQWFTLQSFLPIPSLWLWLTEFGFISVIAIIMGSVCPYFVGTERHPLAVLAAIAVAILVGGLWVGICQTLVLRRYCPAWRRWPIWSGMSLGIGFLLMFTAFASIAIVANLLIDSSSEILIVVLTLLSVFLPFLILSIPGIIYSILTSRFLSKHCSSLMVAKK